MKPNDYIKKYDLKNSSSKFGTREFVADLTIDFNALISYHCMHDWNYSKFKLCVKDINQKFKSIVAKTAHPFLTDKLWNYFYATVVGPMKDTMFGEQLKREREKYQREREERREFQNFNDYFWQQIFEETLNEILKGCTFTKSTQAFGTLGLNDSATAKDIRSRYKELAFKNHPDKGGSITKFREITEAKDRCLAYATN